MTNLSDLSQHLWNDTKPQNGYKEEALYLNHVLGQYKLYVEMADKVSGRRDVANTFFLTLNGIILGAGAAIMEKGLEFTTKWYLLFPYCVLLLQLFFWWRLILAYKQLNGAKFRIVGELEQRLPASPYGNAEWKFLLKEGTQRKVYWPLTHIEMVTPWIFALGYTIALIVLCVS